MKCIAYRSALAEGYDQVEVLTSIRQVASAENPKRAITGVLLFRQGQMLQVVEGPDKDVDQLFRNIQKDPRHRDIEVLFDDIIHDRSLPEWNMEIAELDTVNQFSQAQIHKAVELTQKNMSMTTDTFLFMIKELLAEPQFQVLLTDAR